MTFSLAFLIGFSVASIPGPIIVLIATETLRKGPRAGLLAMTAPPLIDALVMLPLGLFLQASLFSGGKAVVLGLLGAGLLFWLGLQSIRAGDREKDEGLNGRHIGERGKREISPFVKGVLTHLTNPYPYLYWGTAGSSFIRMGLEEGGTWRAVLLPLGFWAGAMTFTLLVIYLLARGKRLLSSRAGPHLHYLSGLLLIGSGVFLAARVWREFF